MNNFKKSALQTVTIASTLIADIFMINLLSNESIARFGGPMFVGTVIMIGGVLLAQDAYELGEKESQSLLKKSLVESWPNDWFITNTDIIDKNKVKIK